MNTNEVLLRKWKRQKELGAAVWDFEIGDDGKAFDPESDTL